MPGVVPNVAQVDRGVPFSMGMSLKDQADRNVSEEITRLESTEAEIKKAAEEVKKPLVFLVHETQFRCFEL